MKYPAKIILLLVLLPAIAVAASWWNKDWKYRKEIGFDLSAAGADVTGTVSDVPVLVRLSAASFAYFNDTKPDAADFRLLSGDDKTPLKFHFEKYDPQNQMALLWVRLPQADGGSKGDKIYAYYGNPDAPAAGDVPGTYDTAQVLVLSFSNEGSLPADLTAYKNNPSSSNAELIPASLIGGGAKFSGAQSIVVPSTASLRVNAKDGFTGSAWVRIAEPQRAVILSVTDQSKQLALLVTGNRFAARATLDGPAVMVSSSSDFTLNEWHHVAFTAASDKLTLYVDGLPISSAPIHLSDLGGTFAIGAANGAEFLTGEVDEVEASKVVRSGDWIKMTERSQAADGNLVLFGADGQREGGGQTSYFVTIAKNLTVDGWVVIGICMAMLVIAIGIMIVKAFVLSRVERANSRFMQEFRALGGDPTVLAEDRAVPAPDALDEQKSMAKLAEANTKYQGSTLYLLYQSGIFELNKRISGRSLSAQRAQTLSAQSIDAIRASMDASMTRLQQALSSQMVLLTIAISGGPFLGLLGTVIGVMITFAAIALSGDVNVNAIAPGTAAALAATVAGLSVAIPSLFGYNWLNMRIKSISADNRVFVDEFVTRLAERYS